MNKWEFWVDRGGTFTDVIGLRNNQEIFEKKILSESFLYDDPVSKGINYILRDYGKVNDEITSVRLGTTIATNAYYDDSTIIILSGFYAGYNATIICQSIAKCEISCWANGCFGTYLNCLPYSNCEVYNCDNSQNLDCPIAINLTNPSHTHLFVIYVSS